MLKKVLVAASTLVVALVTLTLVVLLGTLTHADAVGYLDGIDGEKLTRPLPGQLYVVSPEGKIEQQLCRIEEFRFDIERLSGRTFINRLGERVPGVLNIATPHLLPGQPGEQEFGISYRLEWSSLDHEFATADDLILVVKGVLEKRGCDEAIKRALESGLEVCQLKEVFRERTGRPLAVRFGVHCLALDPDGEPRRLPELSAGSFWTSVKLGLGLVHELRAPEVVAGNEAG